MASESVTVYLKGDRNVEVTKRDVTLGDILEIECADKLLQSKIQGFENSQDPRRKGTAFCNLSFKNHRPHP